MDLNLTSQQVRNYIPNPEGIGGFEPGVSGNPGGRPKVSITAEMTRYLEFTRAELTAELGREDLTAKQKIALTQVVQALTGNDKIESLAVDRVLDRTEGKALQRVEIGGTAELEENRRLLAELVGLNADSGSGK